MIIEARHIVGEELNSGIVNVDDFLDELTLDIIRGSLLLTIFLHLMVSCTVRKILRLNAIHVTNPDEDKLQSVSRGHVNTFKDVLSQNELLRKSF